MSATILRVVVSLDAAADNRGAIETAARLAARAEAPLHGIFIEDEELLHVAALPFTRQLAPGIGGQPFTVEDTELQLKAIAERVRRELVAAAQRHRVEASFEVVRGGSGAVLSGILCCAAMSWQLQKKESSGSTRSIRSIRVWSC